MEVWRANKHLRGCLAAGQGQPTTLSNTNLLSDMVYAITAQGDEKAKGQHIT